MEETKTSNKKSPQQATIDEIRARELYKYFSPPAKDGLSPDPILTAHAQLVAWRLDVQRAMISLIDEDTQYFVAESTKTLQLDNAHEHEHPDDAIWAGCVRVSKAGRLCEHTIAASPPESGGPAYFEVLDLFKDARFNSLEFVTGPPHFRNYAGVPLQTRKGINIGSIFVIDSRVRPALTLKERHFLGVVANNVVQHLELLKDRKDCERALNMSACLSEYVDPLHRVTRRDSLSNLHNISASYSSPWPKNEHDNSNEVSNDDRITTLRRAAGLLYKGLDLDDNASGVLFLDTLPSGSEADYSADESFGSSSDQESDRDASVPANRFRVKHSKQSFSQFAAQKEDSPAITTEILAHANTTKSEAPRINLLRPKALTRLIKRYPEGKLFTFDSQGHVLTSSSDESTRHRKVSCRPQGHTKTISNSDIAKLARCFPNTRQIIFLPVWDSSTSRWTVCIAYHGSDFRNLSYESELVYCATFGNTVAADLMKIASMQANQQKSDFVASISHELRSPLHGILASCEFLADTEVTPQQQSFISTADSCARTLLDTINMVLDYSNINRFEKRAKEFRKSRRGISANSQSKEMLGHLSTHRTLDVAALIEEVMDGLAAGHVFQDRLIRKNSLSIDPSFTSPPEVSMSSNAPGQPGKVELILDIDVHDWTCNLEPGALRRIVMILVENAVKFTTDGFVHVKLECSEPKNTTGDLFIMLTVTDSGQGIEPIYLKNTVFAPFSQESTLTSGTGLGLSLLRSIVRAMGGKIKINSTVGVGTRVTVKLPLVRPSHCPRKRDEIPAVVHFDNTAECKRSTAISTVRQQAADKTAALYWHDQADSSRNRNVALRLLHASLATYLSRWFGISLSPWTDGVKYDIIISTFDGLRALEELRPDMFEADTQDMILIIGTTASPSDLGARLPNSNNIVMLGCPFGPSKLANALKRCLDGVVSDALAPADDGQHGSAISSSLRGEEHSACILDTALADNRTIENEVPRHRGSVVSDVSLATEGLDLISTLSLGVAHAADPATSSSWTSPYSSNSSDLAPDDLTSAMTPRTPSPNELDTATTEPTIASTQAVGKASVKALSTVKVPAKFRPRMLLVDDNAINLRILQVYCKKLGYTDVYSAQNGQIAVDTYDLLLKATPSTPPDIILMDISMPVMNGFEATRQIRKREASSSKGSSHAESSSRSFIVALTGLASLRDQREAFAAGVDRYMIKPVNFANLALLLGKWQSHRFANTKEQGVGIQM